MRKTKKTKGSKDASKSISNAAREQNCLAADIQQEDSKLECANSSQLMQDYAQQVESMKRAVENDLVAQKYSFKLAKIGYDIYTDIEVYDYDIMLDILQGNGYCYDCANAYIDSFTLTSELSVGSEKLVIRRKEKVATEFMFSKMIERQAAAQKKQAEKERK